MRVTGLCSISAQTPSSSQFQSILLALSCHARRAYFPLCFKISANPTQDLTYPLSPWMTLGPCTMVTESCLERGIWWSCFHLPQSGAPGCLGHQHWAGRHDKALEEVNTFPEWQLQARLTPPVWSRLPLKPGSISLSGHPGAPLTVLPRPWSSLTTAKICISHRDVWMQRS